MKQLVLDTNLLVLFIVGLTNKNFIKKHKRTLMFDVDDFDFLMHYISKFDQIVVTPQILTETSNLLSQSNPIIKVKILKTLISIIEAQHEEYIPSTIIVTNVLFERLGISDCGLLQILDEHKTLLSTDGKLCYEATRLNRNAVNFIQICYPDE